MSNVTVFNNESFGALRTIERDGEIWFVASDVAKALGYQKPANAVARHCRYTLNWGIPHPQGNGTLEVYSKMRYTPSTRKWFRLSKAVIYHF